MHRRCCWRIAARSCRSTAAADELLAQDRIDRAQLRALHWGRYVAGTTGVLPAGETRTLSLPFAGRYRLEGRRRSSSGRRVEPGEVVHVDAGQLRLPARQLARGGRGSGFWLVTGHAARPAPDSPPPRGRIYDALTPID